MLPRIALIAKMNTMKGEKLPSIGQPRELLHQARLAAAHGTPQQDWSILGDGFCYSFLAHSDRVHVDVVCIDVFIGDALIRCGQQVCALNLNHFITVGVA